MVWETLQAFFYDLKSPSWIQIATQGSGQNNKR